MIRDKVSGPTCSNTTVIASTITNPIVTSLATLRIWIMWSKCPKICYLLETHFLHRRKDTRKTCSLEKLACTKQTIPMSTVNFVKKKKLTDQNKMQTPPPPPPPPPGKKILFFGAKSWFFTRNTPKMFAPPSAIGKKYDFFGVKSWFFTRNTPKIFVPPSTRRNFFKCAPLTWNPGSAPEHGLSG